jgi:hypothetical protein
MSSNDFLKGLAALGQYAVAYGSLLNQADQLFSTIYQQMDVQMLIHNAVCSAMTPKCFGQYLVAYLEEDNPLLFLGSETLVERASECLWQAVRKRNLEMTVLTTFQQGLVIAQKNCRY